MTENLGKHKWRQGGWEEADERWEDHKYVEEILIGLACQAPGDTAGHPLSVQAYLVSLNGRTFFMRISSSQIYNGRNEIFLEEQRRME